MQPLKPIYSKLPEQIQKLFKLSFTKMHILDADNIIDYKNVISSNLNVKWEQ